MKKIVLTMVALLSLTMAQAQNENGERKAPKKMDPQEMVDRMAKDLNLTADQKTKVAEVMKDQQAEMKRHQEKMKETDEKMKKVLTDEQYKNWQKMQHHRGGQGGRGQGGPRGNRGPRPNGPRPDMMPE